MVGHPARLARRTYFWTLASLRLRPLARAGSATRWGGVLFLFLNVKKWHPNIGDDIFARQNMLVTIFSTKSSRFGMLITFLYQLFTGKFGGFLSTDRGKMCGLVWLRRFGPLWRLLSWKWWHHVPQQMVDDGGWWGDGIPRLDWKKRWIVRKLRC